MFSGNGLSLCRNILNVFGNLRMLHSFENMSPVFYAPRPTREPFIPITLADKKSEMVKVGKSDDAAGVHDFWLTSGPWRELGRIPRKR